MWSVSPMLFQVFGPGGRRRDARLDHRVPVDVVAIGCRGRGSAIRGNHGITARGGCGAVAGGEGSFDRGATAVVVDVGNNYGFCRTIRTVAVGPPKQSQHNIQRKRCADTRLPDRRDRERDIIYTARQGRTVIFFGETSGGGVIVTSTTPFKWETAICI